MRRILTELASKPDLISGIYNYCDRWCERCPLTSRCLVYATEQEDADGSPESHDIQNLAFWAKLGHMLQEAHKMIDEWAREMKIDLNESDEEAGRRKKQTAIVDNHPLALAGKKYANDAAEWFRTYDQRVAPGDQPPSEHARSGTEIADALEVLTWYQYQIAVKTIRALSSSIECAEFERELEAQGDQKDSDGSAKVALMGIDRSIAAWHLLQVSEPDQKESIVPLILQLERLRVRVERKFPAARSFIRPGFDELLDEVH
jgi:hypothetical protein